MTQTYETLAREIAHDATRCSYILPDMRGHTHRCDAATEAIAAALRSCREAALEEAIKACRDATFHPARVLRLLAVVECANDYINTSYSLEGRAMQIERMRNALAALTEDHPNDRPASAPSSPAP